MRYGRTETTTAFAASTSPPGRPPRSPALASKATSTGTALAPNLISRWVSRSTRAARLQSFRCAAPPRTHCEPTSTSCHPADGASIARFFSVCALLPCGIAGRPPHSQHRHRHRGDHHARRWQRPRLPRRRQRKVQRAARGRDRAERRFRARGGARLARTALLTRAAYRGRAHIPMATRHIAHTGCSRFALTPLAPSASQDEGNNRIRRIE